MKYNMCVGPIDQAICACICTSNCLQ